MSSDRWKPPETAGEPRPGPLPRPTLRLSGVFVGLVALGLGIAWALGPDRIESARVGEPAPDFTVELIGGGTFDLSDRLAAADGPIVVNLWASWCLPCREEIPELSAFSEAQPGVTVIGVAVEDSKTAAVEFAREMSPAYDLALGDAAFEEAYPRLGLPVTYVVDPDGIVVEMFNGALDRAALERLVFG